MKQEFKEKAQRALDKFNGKEVEEVASPKKGGKKAEEEVKVASPKKVAPSKEEKGKKSKK